MSQRGSGTFPENNAISTPSAAHCAANDARSTAGDDHRLSWLIDAWQTLSDDTRDAMVRLAAGPGEADDRGDVAVTPAVQAVSR